MKTMRKRRFLSCFAAAALFTALILPGSVAADPAQTTLDMLYEPEATQYGTVIYVATTAPYGDTLGSAYNAMHNADFTGNTVATPSYMTRALNSFVRLNGRLLSEVNTTDAPNIINVQMEKNYKGNQRFTFIIDKDFVETLGIAPGKEFTIEFLPGMVDMDNNPIAPFSKKWTGTAYEDYAPVVEDTKVTDFTKPTYSDKYTLTEFMFLTDGAWGAGLGSYYTAAQWPGFTGNNPSTPEAMTAALREYLLINGKKLSEVNTDSAPNAIQVDISKHAAEGKQMFIVHVVDGFLSDFSIEGGFTVQLLEGFIDLNGNPVEPISKRWNGENWEEYNPAPGTDETKVTAFTKPIYSSQYTLTEFYFLTDAAWGAALGTNPYIAVQNADYTGNNPATPAGMPAAMSQFLLINGKKLSEVNTDSAPNAIQVNVIKEPDSGMQQFNVQIRDGYLDGFDKDGFTVELLEGFIDLDGNAFEPVSKKWNGTAWEDYTPEPAPGGDKTAVTGMTNPNHMEQWGLTEIRIQLDAPWTAEMQPAGGFYEALTMPANPAFDASTPEFVPAMLAANVRINGKLLSQINTADAPGVVNMRMENIGGTQLYSIIIMDGYLDVGADKDFTLEFLEGMKDFSGKAIEPFSLRWDASESKWVTYTPPADTDPTKGDKKITDVRYPYIFQQDRLVLEFTTDSPWNSEWAGFFEAVHRDFEDNDPVTPAYVIDAVRNHIRINGKKIDAIDTEEIPDLVTVRMHKDATGEYTVVAFVIYMELIPEVSMTQDFTVEFLEGMKDLYGNRIEPAGYKWSAADRAWSKVPVKDYPDNNPGTGDASALPAVCALLLCGAVALAVSKRRKMIP